MAPTTQTQLGDILERIAESLDIPDELYEEAEQKYAEVSHWLEDQDTAIARRQPDVYPQGSFALGTVTRPIDGNGEYDIDLVCERDLRKASISQQQLKEEAGEHLNSYVAFLQESHKDSPDLESGRRCWTLNYPDQFHMDILPAIPDDAGRVEAGVQSKTKILITDVEVREWKYSNPKGYANWFREQMKIQFLEKRAAIARANIRAKSTILNEQLVKEAAEQIPDYKVKTPLQRAIQILKRHRDYYFKNDGDNRPVSIILTTLAASSYSNEDNLIDALGNLIEGMPKHIEEREVNGVRVAWVPNPVNRNENFADRWQDKDFPDRESKFRAWLLRAKQDFDLALKGGGLDKVIQILGQSLGEGVVKEAAAKIATGYQQQSSTGALGMATGTGAITLEQDTDGSTTPLRRHTFYGDREKNSDS